MQPGFPDIEALIPHRDTMRLIDRVTVASDKALTVEALIRPSSPFMIEGHGIPSYVGLEMMAQSICAFDGLQRFRDGQAPSIGFLLGCRKYTAHQHTLPLSEKMLITSEMSFSDGEMAAFDCTIDNDHGARLAEGTITVYQHAEVVLNAQKNVT